ncbi:MAG: hypothetical protein HYS17_01130 [Micavibrio aeruginosavorus]|uniref:Uncharacterized protein n=1 Tax=Micavibrio aeruginosavorus TaxID=349221 RepID=A0A7T5UHX9_9BACT|nr:MAG: hypothetical protein HYS17_01130 [Micavibrio aeruginosavorus]
MPRRNSIVKNYYLEADDGRGSIWTIWLSPALTGFNDVYFAGSGYRRPNSNNEGFLFHLSHHKDGRSHIKNSDEKIHKFRLTNQNNFPICSVYAHSKDLLVPLEIPENIKGEIIPVDIRLKDNPDSYEWCELFFAHFEISKTESFLRKYTGKEYEFNVVDQIDIGQGKEILVLFRFVRSVATSGKIPNLSKEVTYSNRNRLTVWGFRCSNEKHVTIHDLAANKIDRISQLYRKSLLLRALMSSASYLGF